jgi:hypothetical protein
MYIHIARRAGFKKFALFIFNVRKIQMIFTFNYMIKKAITILLFLLPIMALAQSRSYDRLIFNYPPDGWSTQTLMDRLIFSNDNIKGAEALEVSILKGNSNAEKPELAFKKYWQQYFQLADTATTPKTRKLYNNDGNAMLSASMEMIQNNEKHYYMLTMYFDEKYAQCIVIKANSLKAYKPVQYEWLEKLQAVSFSKK